VKLWVAQGFGLGRIPVAPGTFGSILGLGWFALLVASGKWWLLPAGSVIGFGISVWLCGEAERLLKAKDPGSVVLDEVVAIPVCFFSWIAGYLGRTSSFPSLDYFAKHWLGVAGVFAAFRFFDVVKPWPVRRSQSLPGGWGVTIDDYLAAFYVNVVVAVVLFAAGLWGTRGAWGVKAGS
jgi:phosphatidylglycerophosphatase A